MRFVSVSRKCSRNDFGNAALIGVLVAMALTGLMLSISGLGMLDILRGAREQKLEANFIQAVSVVEARIQQEPEWLNISGSKAGSDTSGVPTIEFIDILIADGADYTWRNAGTATDGWDLQPTDDDTTIRIQFLLQSSALSAGTNTVGPTVPWLLQSGAAIRLQSRNSEGAWVCALVVGRPSVSDTEAIDATHYLEDAITYTGSTPPILLTGEAATVPISSDVAGYTGRKTSAWLGGTWYDQGDSYSNSTHHCDPIGVDTTGASQYYYPIKGNRWVIGTNNGTNIINQTQAFTRALA